MSRKKQAVELTFVGIDCEGGWLRIHMSASIGLGKRYIVMPVPLTEFLHPQVTEHIEIARKRAAIPAWEDLPLDLAW